MKRTVFCEDAVEWMQNHAPDPASSWVVSLPDISEFSGSSLANWKLWFVNTAALLLSRCPERGLAFFYQSDIRLDGVWIDKGYMCMKAAEQMQCELLFHKIVCRVPPDTVTLGRPVYSHVFCFSKSLRLPDPKRMLADVSSDTGNKTWTRGMGLKTALGIAEIVAHNTDSKKIINPFCGEGSMLAAANHVGLEAIGIERSPKRAEKSRQLKVGVDGKVWSS